MTDTEKWGKPWFRKLPSKMKCAWFFLLDKCDHAGIWDIDFDSMSYHIGEPIGESDFFTYFEDKIEISDDKMVIPAFIEFQYGELDEGNRVHKSVLSKLEKLTPSKPLTRPLQGCKDKEKDKAKDKDKEKDKDKFSKEDFDLLYQEYPRKVGKALGIRRCFAEIKTVEKYDLLRTAISRYSGYCLAQKTEPKYIQHFSTFMTSWTDWLDPGAGTSTVKTADEDRFAFLDKAGA